MKVTICFCLLFLFIKTSGQPVLGNSLTNPKYNVVDSLTLLTSPSELEKAYNLIVDSIKYYVTVNAAMRIRFILTADESFICPEKLKVGDTYSALVLIQPGLKLYDYRGWGKFFKLRSGWRAVFDYKSGIGDNSTIEFFFMR